MQVFLAQLGRVQLLPGVGCDEELLAKGAAWEGGEGAFYSETLGICLTQVPQRSIHRDGTYWHHHIIRRSLSSGSPPRISEPLLKSPFQRTIQTFYRTQGHCSPKLLRPSKHQKPDKLSLERRDDGSVLEYPASNKGQTLRTWNRDSLRAYLYLLINCNEWACQCEVY